jgi:mono/diheme cytochrome c family protein
VLRLERIVPALLTLLAISCRQATLPEADARTRELAAGQRIFLRKCVSCHNTNGDGKTITASRFPYANLIDGIWRSDGSPGAIERQIRRGHDPMPKFEGKLTDEQIRQTVAYVLELSRNGAEAGGKKPALRSLGEGGTGGEPAGGAKR